MTAVAEKQAENGQDISSVEVSQPKLPHWALYIRLSREDGDKAESLSVEHQRMKLTAYAEQTLGTTNYEVYVDDGWTGTNFQRPAFQRILADIAKKQIIGIVVKDLSRLGRDNPKSSYYVHDFFPENKVRLIAIDDNVDKNYYDLDTSEDMMIDVKNMFNGFYPRDISNKVRSTFRTKQHAGKFIGAFASYGYKKDSTDHNQLVVDEPAAEVVRRIFSMYLSGLGQNTIAKRLNEENIPCPSEYKKMQGLNYRNCNRLESTAYWTYSSIRNILRNEIYTGVMVQNKSFRQICKHKAMKLPKEEWIIVPDTHEAIIDRNTFDKVQQLLSQNTRQTNLNQNIHFFAGLIKCGDCHRAMAKIQRQGVVTFSCGSYNRYGTSKCSAHYIREEVLNQIILDDLNAIIANIKSLEDIIKAEEQDKTAKEAKKADEVRKLKQEIERFQTKKKRAYEDYAEDLISKEDYISYKARYEAQIQTLNGQIAFLTGESTGNGRPTRSDWLNRLLEIGHVEEMTRQLAVEMIGQIYIYQNNTIKIIYNFSDELEDLISENE